MPEARRKPGPRSKGSRYQQTIRVPVDQFAVYQAQAREAGLDVGDYVVARLAEAHELPVPSYIGAWPRQQDETLFRATG